MIEGKPAVFISCSERYRVAVARPFHELLEAIGMHGIIVSEAPRLVRSWTPEEKLTEYLRRSEALLVLLTPDEATTDGAWHARQNLYDEMGRARAMRRLKARICVLKEPSVVMASNIDVAYDALDLADLSGAQRSFMRQLRAWEFQFEEPVITSQPTAAPAATLSSTGLLEGLDRVEPERTARRVRGFLAKTPKREQPALVARIAALTRQGSEEDQATAASMLETVMEVDPALVSAVLLDDLARSENHAVRISAAVCLFLLATLVPGLVPVDIVQRLARPSVEDWYVYTPAVNCLKELALSRPEALEVVAGLAHSASTTDREYAVAALRDISVVRPDVVPRALVKQLAEDTDPAVKKEASRLLRSLPAGEEERLPYQHFGAF